MPIYFFQDAVTGSELAYASVFAGNFAFLLSILIAVLATSWVFRAAKKMRGGLFASVLNYIGIGMLLVVLGSFSSIFGDWLPGLWPHIINMVCFSLGYVFMVLGGYKLIKGIMTP